MKNNREIRGGAKNIPHFKPVIEHEREQTTETRPYTQSKQPPKQIQQPQKDDGQYVVLKKREQQPIQRDREVRQDIPPQYLSLQSTGPGGLLMSPPQNMPVVKQYIVTPQMLGVGTGTSFINEMYENSVPRPLIETKDTVAGRLNWKQHIKSILFPNGDGTDVDISGTSGNGLMNNLSFMEINPYNTAMHANDPYFTLPENMVIYRTCFPITHGDRRTIQCAKGAEHINIKISRLTVGEFNTFDIKPMTMPIAPMAAPVAAPMAAPVAAPMAAPVAAPMAAPVAAPMAAPVAAPMAAPVAAPMAAPVAAHMAAPMAAHMARHGMTKTILTVPPAPTIAIKNKYDYDVWRELLYYQHINKLVGKYESSNFVTMHGYYLTSKCNINFNKINLIKRKIYNNEPFLIPLLPGQSLLSNPNPNAYIGNGLIILTESPSYTLTTWGSNVYKVDGNIRKMVNIGSHSDNEWYSILFQLFIAMLTMYKENIAFDRFDLDENVFIKESESGRNSGYWKYIIDGVEFFVPNYGYTVLIDSSFKKDVRHEHMIYSDKFKDDQNYVNALNVSNIRKIFNSNSFKSQFTQAGAAPPSMKVLNFIDLISNELNTLNPAYFAKIPLMTFRMFMNNRIGTYLKDDEVEFVKKIGPKNFKKGDIVVHEDKNDRYKVVLYVNSDRGRTYIIDDRNTNSINNIHLTSLFGYSDLNGPLTQNTEPNKTPIDNDSMLETYKIYL